MTAGDALEFVRAEYRLGSRHARPWPLSISRGGE